MGGRPDGAVECSSNSSSTSGIAGNQGLVASEVRGGGATAPAAWRVTAKQVAWRSDAAYAMVVPLTTAVF